MIVYITYTNKNPKGGAVCTPYDKCKKARNATECNQGKSLVWNKQIMKRNLVCN